MSKSEGFPVDIKTTPPEVEVGLKEDISPCVFGQNKASSSSREDLNIFVYACDFSPRAVEFVKLNPLYCPERCHAFQCDLTKDDLRGNVLKPGGMVLFRDYGLNDHAMLRFKAGSKLGENFYVRQDGTRSYFFSKEFLSELFADAGLQSVSNDYVLRETVNKKEGLANSPSPANRRAPDATRPITQLLTPTGLITELLTPPSQSQSS
ncbi:hypothetical protein F7725_017883 [Dissostichus mawsoni]|uniref:Uncharacterized protein n=1 Tax=Dissostichus mawsoni TaxID=36200 RepID=A0A7J5XPV3_DISMA|nr:hypothetical protein F7725_017883 [Dissostichus mawsoni]